MRQLDELIRQWKVVELEDLDRQREWWASLSPDEDEMVLATIHGYGPQTHDYPEFCSEDDEPIVLLLPRRTINIKVILHLAGRAKPFTPLGDEEG